MQQLLWNENADWQDFEHIAGVDEAGRGPLAGPVIAAAVILDPQRPIMGLADSKQLTAVVRTTLAEEIKAYAKAWAIGRAEVEEIDRYNILQATLLAMQRALQQLSVAPQAVWVDGNQVPNIPWPVQAVVRGDELIPQISAASILAKVARDAEMCELDALHPGYGFAQHKGYATPGHLEVLQILGPSSLHRVSFAPVAALINVKSNL